jgi:DNA-3-methyladenine glycosylase
VEPVEGSEAMRAARLAAEIARRRGLDADAIERLRDRLWQLPDARLASGPGLAADALDLTLQMSGLNLLDPASHLRLELPPVSGPAPAIVATRRIGVDYAGEPWSGRPWRFVIQGHPSVSGGRVRAARSPAPGAGPAPEA